MKRIKIKILKSKIGLILAGIYLVLSAISIYYSRICNVGICDVGYLILPAIPWIGLFGDGRYSFFPYALSIFINLLIFYFIGYYINKLIIKFRKSKK